MRLPGAVCARPSEPDVTVRFGAPAETVHNRPVRRLSLAAAVFAATVAAAGCGGGDGGASGTPPDEFAASVCGAIGDWQKSLQSGAQKMGADLGAASTPDQVKSKLVEFMGNSVEATDTMISKVKQAGPPAVDDGEQLQNDLVSGLEKASTAFKQAETQAKNLPTGNQADFQREAQDLTQTLQTQGTAIETTFNNLDKKYDSEELDKAFDEEPACKSI